MFDENGFMDIKFSDIRKFLSNRPFFEPLGGVSAALRPGLGSAVMHNVDAPTSAGLLTRW